MNDYQLTVVISETIISKIPDLAHNWQYNIVMLGQNYETNLKRYENDVSFLDFLDIRSKLARIDYDLFFVGVERTNKNRNMSLNGTNIEYCLGPVVLIESIRDLYEKVYPVIYAVLKCECFIRSKSMICFNDTPFCRICNRPFFCPSFEEAKMTDDVNIYDIIYNIRLKPCYNRWDITQSFANLKLSDLTQTREIPIDFTVVGNQSELIQDLLKQIPKSLEDAKYVNPTNFEQQKVDNFGSFKDTKCVVPANSNFEQQKVEYQFVEKKEKLKSEKKKEAKKVSFLKMLKDETATDTVPKPLLFPEEPEPKTVAFRENQKKGFLADLFTFS